MTLYRGWKIDLVGTELSVSKGDRFMELVPKREGMSFLDCAKEYIDRLENEKSKSYTLAGPPAQEKCHDD